jgi:hypothetical protein
MKTTFATSKFLLTVTAAAVALAVCASRSHAAEGERPSNDVPNAGQEVPLWAQPAQPATSPSARPGVQATVARPDLAFKKAEMDLSVRMRPVMIQNVGTAASAATTVSCDGSTQRIEDAMKRAGAGAGEAPIAYNVPALAPGATFQVPTAMETADLTRWSCSVMAVSGESNTVNNQYAWRKAATVGQPPFRDPRRVPGRVEN